MNSFGLDVVVLGGGGHVGLPLSLAFATSGLRVGVYDTNVATHARIRRGEMPFREGGADEPPAEVLPTGRLILSADPAMVALALLLSALGAAPAPRACTTWSTGVSAWG